MNNDLFVKYAEIEKQIKSLEGEKETLQPLILTELKVNRLDTLKQDFGTFSVVSRKTYKYTDIIKDIIEKKKQ
jgi:hypothetical protein